MFAVQPVWSAHTISRYDTMIVQNQACAYMKKKCSNGSTYRPSDERNQSTRVRTKNTEPPRAAISPPYMKTPRLEEKEERGFLDYPANLLLLGLATGGTLRVILLDKASDALRRNVTAVRLSLSLSVHHVESITQVAPEHKKKETARLEYVTPWICSQSFLLTCSALCGRIPAAPKARAAENRSRNRSIL